ncbi:MAG: ABC transporter substrate-binding protein [Thermodesulfobacteriota bacterium]
MWRKLFPLLISCLILTCKDSLAQESPSKKPFRIGVTQSFSHPDFDNDGKGFEKALSEAGFKEGIHVIFIRQSAQNDRGIAHAIAQQFLEKKLDLIHSIGTLSSQATTRVIKETPIVFSSVTDPIRSEIVPSKSSPGTKTGTNVTGVSDRWPTSIQFEMHTKFFPKAKKWGTIYSSGDPASLDHIKEMREIRKKLGIELIEVLISSTEDVPKAAQSLVGKVEAIHLFFDPKTLSGLDAIIRICNRYKIPLFSGDAGSVVRGALAAYSLDYFEIGYSAGKKTVQILKGEKAGNIPWDQGEKFNLIINEKAEKAQGAVIPLEFLKKANRVVRE